MDANMYKFFAGIGSRSTPESYIPLIEKISEKLISRNYILRSGGASGADTFWENAYDKFGGKKEIYLPWKNFNNNSSELYHISNEALERAEYYHPNWSSLSDAAKKLHARNTYQILGDDSGRYNTNGRYFGWSFSDMVICYTADGKDTGGTGQAIRIARQYNVPVYNLYHYGENILQIIEQYELFS